MDGSRRGSACSIHGAAGGVGHFATQLARWRGAHVIGTASRTAWSSARAHGAHEVLDGRGGRFEEALAPVDLVFDTVGGELLERSPATLRPGGRLVSVAEEPPPTAGEIHASYFVVEPNRAQLVEIARLVDEGCATTGDRLCLFALRGACRVRAKPGFGQARESRDPGRRAHLNVRSRCLKSPP